MFSHISSSTISSFINPITIAKCDDKSGRTGSTVTTVKSPVKTASVSNGIIFLILVNQLKTMVYFI